MYSTLFQSTCFKCESSRTKDLSQASHLSFFAIFSAKCIRQPLLFLCLSTFDIVTLQSGHTLATFTETSTSLSHKIYLQAYTGRLIDLDWIEPITFDLYRDLVQTNITFFALQWNLQFLLPWIARFVWLFCFILDFSVSSFASFCGKICRGKIWGSKFFGSSLVWRFSTWYSLSGKPRIICFLIIQLDQLIQGTQTSNIPTIRLQWRELTFK